MTPAEIIQKINQFRTAHDELARAKHQFALDCGWKFEDYGIYTKTKEDTQFNSTISAVIEHERDWAGKTESLFLIECKEHRQSDLRLWWLPNSRGYTFNVNKAGRYTAEQVKTICHDGNDDIAWPESSVIDASIAAVIR